MRYVGRSISFSNKCSKKLTAGHRGHAASDDCEDAVTVAARVVVQASLCFMCCFQSLQADLCEHQVHAVPVLR